MHSEDRQAGSDKGKTRTGRRQGPARPRRTPGALQLSRVRQAAPKCGKRGSHGRYKGWAARMSTVRGARGEGARGEGAGPPGPGGGRPAPPSPPVRPGVRPRRGATPRRGTRPPGCRVRPWGRREGPAEGRGPRRPRRQGSRDECGAAAGARGEVARRAATGRGWRREPASPGLGSGGSPRTVPAAPGTRGPGELPGTRGLRTNFPNLCSR